MALGEPRHLVQTGRRGLALCGPLFPKEAHRRGRLRGPRRRLRRGALLGVRTARDFPALSREALIMDGVVPVTPGMNRARVVNIVTPWTVIRDPPVGAPIKVQGVSVRTVTARWTPQRPVA